jgi:nitroimidazol reductase NimA-like FMN-containing flavoprotein (pyridoxamine 5'-phosphate oxidase superfamily)
MNTDKIGSNEEEDARVLVAANRFMTLATADAAGEPWASPVWYATDDGYTFLWASSPETRHSRNLAERPRVAIVIFDSHATRGEGNALYLSAVARELTDDEVEPSLELYSRRSQEQGYGAWSLDEITGPARHRLYRAVADERFLLGPRDERIAI